MVILLYLPLVDQYKGKLFDYRIEQKIKVGGIKKKWSSEGCFPKNSVARQC